MKKAQVEKEDRYTRRPWRCTVCRKRGLVFVHWTDDAAMVEWRMKQAHIGSFGRWARCRNPKFELVREPGC